MRILAVMVFGFWLLYHWVTEPIYRLFGGRKPVDFVHNSGLKPK